MNGFLIGFQGKEENKNRAPGCFLKLEGGNKLEKGLKNDGKQRLGLINVAKISAQRS